MSKSSYVLIGLVLILSQTILIMSVSADNANFKLEPLADHVITLSLKETDRVAGSFSVVSDDETGVNFYVSDPQDQSILRYENVGQKSFSFTAEATGNYELHFENSVSSVFTKTVAVNYNVTHYIMDLPQEQFLLIIIFACALIGIVIYVALSPK